MALSMALGAAIAVLVASIFGTETIVEIHSASTFDSSYGSSTSHTVLPSAQALFAAGVIGWVCGRVLAMVASRR